MDPKVRFLLFQLPYSTTSIHETIKKRVCLEVHFTEIYDEGGRIFIFFTIPTTSILGDPQGRKGGGGPQFTNAWPSAD